MNLSFVTTAVVACWTPWAGFQGLQPVGATFGRKEVPAKLSREQVRAELLAKAPARRERAEEEIERLGEHSWAGVYRGDCSISLVIAPEAGYTAYEGTWCGLCSGWLSMGSVLDYDGSKLALDVELEYDLPPEKTRTGTWFRFDNLYLVPWGDFLFAVPPWRMELFCSEVSDRYSMPDVPFRYDGDDTDFDHRRARRPDGFPRVPSEYERFVLREPIVGKIASLRSRDPGKPPRADRSTFVVDVGAKHGLAVAMRLFVPDTEYPFRNAQVVQVGPTTSLVRLYTFPEEELVGLGTTTQHPAYVD